MAKKPRRLRGAASALGKTKFGILDMGHTAANAAVLLSVAVVCIALFFQMPFNALDPQRCSTLIRRGAWPPYLPPQDNTNTDDEPLGQLEKDGRELSLERPFDKWEPAGCRMHEYSRDNIRDCLGGQRLLFVGDATARVLFFAAMTRLDHEEAEWALRETFSDADPRHDLVANVETVQLEFLWDPWLNSSIFQKEILRMRPSMSSSSEPSALWSELPQKPALMVVASNGLWAARNAEDAYFGIFRNASDFVASAMQDVVRPSGAFDDSEALPGNSLFLAPVPVPRYVALQPSRAKTLTPQRINRMNQYLENLPSAVRSHILTAYTDMMYGVPEAYEDTGLHARAVVAERWIDIPLNARCNGKLAEPGAPGSTALEFAYKKTCCLPYPRLKWFQWYLLYSLCATVAVTIAFSFFGYRALPAVFPSLGLLFAACLYCYVADRSHLFSKSEKHYDGSQLLFLSVSTAVVCLWSWKRFPEKLDQNLVNSSKDDNDVSDLALDERPPPVVDFLPRHITDEWKGLMLAVHLLLAYQDIANLPVSIQWTGFATDAYLFLSAFGHASYFLHSGDYSLRRVASVLVRVNALPCLLSFLLDGLASGTSQSVTHLYYFPRLVSFWFLVTVATLWSARHTRGSISPTYMLLRVGMSAMTMWTVAHWPWKRGILETMCSVVSTCFHVQWDTGSTRQVLRMNWLAPYLGMVAAIVVRRSAQLRDEVDNSSLEDSILAPTNAKEAPSASAIDSFLVSTLHNPRTATMVQSAASVCSFACLAFYAYTVQTTSPINEHGVDIPSSPYLASAAVISYAVLRNCHYKLRTVYMGFPAALGVFALELSLLKNHIFLSGNGTGHLKLFLGHEPRRNGSSLGSQILVLLGSVLQRCETVSLTVILMAVSWLVHQSTNTITTSLFGEPKKEQEPIAANPTTDFLALSQMTRQDNSKKGRRKLPVDHWRVAPFTEGRRVSPRNVQLRAASILLFLWIGSLLYV